MLPVVYMDGLFLAGILVATTVVGIVIGGWWASRRGSSSRRADVTSPETRRLLQLMSRADHALESYVTAILGNLSVLGDDLPTDPQRWQVSRDAIANAANQMKRHVQRLRLIRIGIDETNWRVAPVNLVRLIENILIDIEPAATERQVTLRMEVEGPAQPVSADPEMVEEIFTSLLDNAIKHNPADTEVVAELVRMDRMAVVRVSDNGKGIASEVISRIFEEGARERGAGAARGTGMGLYIAKLLTELQGGTIQATSEPGKGSVFTVALPLVRSRS